MLRYGNDIYCLEQGPRGEGLIRRTNAVTGKTAHIARCPRQADARLLFHALRRTLERNA